MPTAVAGKGSGDPVLDSALSEFSSEGVDLDAPVGDPSPDTASQAEADESADQTAAPAKADGDDRSSKAVDTPAVEGTADKGALGDDPLAGTEPFTYTVNGEVKTLEGVFRVPGEGLLVPEDKVQVLTELAARADNLDSVSREYEQRNADFERLSEWRTQGADGREQVYQGRDGLVAMRVELGTRAAAFDILSSVLTPDKNGQYTNFAKLVTVNELNQIVPDPEQLDKLLLRSDLAERDARDAIFRQVGQLSQPTSSSAGPDWNQIAPQIIDRAAGSDSKALTQEDKQFLTSQIDRYERKITEEDRRRDPALKVGNPIIDAKFTALVRQTVNSRIASSKAAQAAEKAGKFNAGQQRGRQPAALPTKPAVPVRAEQTKTGKADWDGPLKAALEEMDIPR